VSNNLHFRGPTMKILLNLTLSLVIFISIQNSHANSHLQCPQVFNRPLKNIKNQKTEVTDLFTFGQAMTEGMLLHPDQEDLFEIYRKTFFGDPKVSVDNKTLNDVSEILSKNPELKKIPFREYEVSSVKKLYSVPDSLSKYVTSQIQSAGNVRSNLLQIEANIGYWRKILDYQEPQMPEGLAKDQQKEWSAKAKFKFEKYLNRIISKTNRGLLSDLKNEQIDYDKKVITLFKTLDYLSKWMQTKNRNTQPIRQAMVDLVHTVGFGNQATLALLKSKNGLDKIEGLKKILDERDSIAMELEFHGHFQELQKSLKVDFPTGLSKNENPSVNIQKLEKEVLNSPFTSLPVETYRVRSLSIQEAPFRSCLGGSDCSSRTYFSKALDPNFNYFTMTDNASYSTGHVTVVLGEATNPKTKHLEPVAFVDKIQNIPNSQLPVFFQAIALSLNEYGYKLGLPEDVGDHNGLSNLENTRVFVKNDVLPLLSHKLSKFKPHAHKYNFQNRYSRAYNDLSLKIYEPVLIDKETEIKVGRHYKTTLAKKNLDKNQLITDFLNLKDSKESQDVLKYVSSGLFIESLEKLNLYTTAEYEKDLEKILQRKDIDFSIKKQALYESFFVNPSSKILKKSKNIFLNKISSFNQVEKHQIGSEIKQWSQSSDKRKQIFADQLRTSWNVAITKGELEQVKSFIDLNLFDVNYKNENGFSGFLMAVEAEQKAIIEFFMNHPQFNLSEKNENGHNLIEQAQLIGKTSLANELESQRSDIKVKNFNVQDKTTKGRPIFNFVKINPGQYFVGDQKKVAVTITKPFDFMSTMTSLKLWTDVVQLAERHLSIDYQLVKDPYANRFDDFWFSSHYDLIVSQHQNNQKGLLSHIFNKFLNIGNKTNPDIIRNNSEDFAVDWVSQVDISDWIKALNQLSELNDPVVQIELEKLLPGHQYGDKYDLPTNAQWEYVARMRGLIAEHIFRDHQVYPIYSVQDPKKYVSTIFPMGTFKPLFIEGQPIYDMNSEVWEFMKDSYNQNRPLGGVDPGMAHIITSADYIIRRSSESSTKLFKTRENNLSFRLVRNPR
jgi:hypothetical protein